MTDLQRRYTKIQRNQLLQTSGQSNLTTGDITATHGQFKGSQGTLAPPGEYDWTCASFDPPKSTIQQSKWQIIVSAILAQLMAKSPYTYNGLVFPSKLPLPIGGCGPLTNTWALGPPNSTQMASRLVQPFLQGPLLVWQTNQLTDRPRYSASMYIVRATRPNNHNNNVIARVHPVHMTNADSQPGGC